MQARRTIEYLWKGQDACVCVESNAVIRHNGMCGDCVRVYVCPLGLKPRQQAYDIMQVNVGSYIHIV